MRKENLLNFDSKDQPHARSIRSFVRREGRITGSQKKALERLWRCYGITPGTKPLNLAALFNQQAQRIILEIGFGNGESLIAQAQAAPTTGFLGIEVHRPGIGHLLLRLERTQLENVRVICGDALEVLQCYLPDYSLAGVQIFFPDPWPKKRHHKRRLIQLPFVEQLWYKIQPKGWLHLATDWQDYAEYMLAVLSQHPGFRRLAETHPPPYGLSARPLTKFELRGQQQGRQIWDLKFKRSGEREPPELGTAVTPTET